MKNKYLFIFALMISLAPTQGHSSWFNWRPNWQNVPTLGTMGSSLLTTAGWPIRQAAGFVSPYIAPRFALDYWNSLPEAYKQYAAALATAALAGYGIYRYTRPQTPPPAQPVQLKFKDIATNNLYTLDTYTLNFTGKNILTQLNRKYKTSFYKAWLPDNTEITDKNLNDVFWKGYYGTVINILEKTNPNKTQQQPMPALPDTIHTVDGQLKPEEINKIIAGHFYLDEENKLLILPQKASDIPTLSPKKGESPISFFIKGANANVKSFTLTYNTYPEPIDFFKDVKDTLPGLNFKLFVSGTDSITQSNDGTIHLDYKNRNYKLDTETLSRLVDDEGKRIFKVIEQ